MSGGPGCGSGAWSRLAARLVHVHASGAALQRLLSVSDRKFADRFGTHRRNSPRQLAFLLGTVAYDHDFIQRFQVHAQLDVDHAAVADGNFLGSKTYSRENQRRVSLGNANTELAILVSGGTRGGVFHQHRHARYSGIVFGGGNGTCNGPILSQQCV